RKGPIRFGGIEERDAAVNGRADDGDSLLAAQRLPVAEADPHAPEAERGNVQSAFSQRACLHVPLLGRSYVVSQCEIRCRAWTRTRSAYAYRLRMLNRRQFLGVVGAAVSLPAFARPESQAGEWGSPVFDLHFHVRAQPAQN